MKGSNKSRWAIAAGLIVVVPPPPGTGTASPRTPRHLLAPVALTTPNGGGRHGMRGGALAPVQAATAVNKAVPRYLRAGNHYCRQHRDGT